MGMVTDQQLTEFVGKLQTMLTALDLKQNNASRATISVERNRSYARLILSHHGQNRSAYGFIDLSNGDLLKAASWKAPAKGVRGNIYAADPLAGCAQYGMVYFN